MLQGGAEDASHSIQEQGLKQAKRAAKDLSAMIDTLILRVNGLLRFEPQVSA